MDAVPRALGQAWTDDTPWDVLTALTALDSRMAGHAGDRRAAEHVVDALGEAGVRDVTTEPFPLPVWTRGDCALRVTAPDERAFNAIALPYAPAGTATGRLVSAGYGAPAGFDGVDVEGAVVVASTGSPPGGDRVHRMEKYGRAVAGGAAGFVFHNQRDGQLPQTGALRGGRVGERPAASVSGEVGSWLEAYAERGGAAELTVDAHTEPGTGVNTHGVLGPDTPTEVVVIAHHDAHDIGEGALDNGCGVATLVAAARVLAAMESVLETRVRLGTVSGEEVGLVGASALADGLDTDAVRAVVNLDGAGRYRTLRAFLHATPAFADVLAAVEDATGHPIDVVDTLHPYSDHWPFLRAGVPAVQLHSVTPERGRGWGHTQADTRDKVDARTLREHGMLAALLVRELAREDTTIPRASQATLRQRLVDAGMRSGMVAADVWPAAWD
ncbi:MULTISPECIES: M28 family metallopeptidase [Halobacterium]|nr:M28 family metallopeptidase [Halobacterium sp. GSL-19]QRY22233.1 M28 family peptidase [Halobacterium sp. GSL-19]